jgi:hypothetical protein
MAWRDLRGTFVGVGIFVIVFAASCALAFKLGIDAAASAKNPSWAQLAREPHAYERFVDAMWFRVPGPSFLIALAAVLIATAIPFRARGRDTQFLLLLPLKRREILWSRVVVFTALMFGLSVTVSLIFVLTGLLALDRTYPIGKALGATVLFTIGSLGWGGISAAIASFVHRAIAAAIVLTMIFFVPLNLFQFTIPPTLGPGLGQKWNPWAMTDPSLWFPGVPWTQIALTLALALAGWFISVRRLESIDV